MEKWESGKMAVEKGRAEEWGEGLWRGWLSRPPAGKRRVLLTECADQTEATLLGRVGAHAGLLAALTFEPSRRLLVWESFGAKGPLDAFLCRRRERDAPLALPTLLRFLEQLSAAVAHLHGANVVHSRLQASRVLVEPQDRRLVVKLFDFRRARQLAAATDSAKEGEALFEGSAWRWAAPETLRKGVLSLASDVWSFGILMYEVLSQGGVPFGVVTDTEEGWKRKMDGAEEKLTPVDGVPAAVWALLESTQALTPPARPTAAALAAALAAAQSELADEDDADAAAPSPATTSRSDDADDDDEVFENSPAPKATHSSHN